MYGFGAAYHGNLLSNSQPPSHNRSVSLGPPDSEPTESSLCKAKSTNALRKAAMADGNQDAAFHTLQDPRSNGSAGVSRSASSASKHPDLNNEITALSDKLISAINHQQTLDDSLAQARHELEAARTRIAELEAREKEQQSKLSRGELVEQEVLQRLKTKADTELEEEKKQRQKAQQEKRGIEAELETLTASLFEEANKLVAAANKEKDGMEKKNQQLRDQIKDEEAVIASQAEQLTELKNIMQQIQADQRKESADSPGPPLDPSSPAIDRDDSITVTRLLEAMNLTPLSPELGVQPSASTRLTHLVRAQCRIDIPAYDEFKEILQQNIQRSYNPSHASSRAGSGSYGGLNVMGLGSMYSNKNGSNPNLAQVVNSKVTNTPSVPGSFNARPAPTEVMALKDTRFFKRLMAEDIEPTLRLDLSTTISWLSRRTILAAIGDNNLSVEPIPEATYRLNGKFTACSLCGEWRKEDQNPRTHAMRVREGEGATKWPICTLCLEKIRAVGDLVSYIRMVRDGVVKVGDNKEEEEVWEELLRHRERLFWARMAGGVVPAFVPSTKNSPVVEFSGEQRAAQMMDSGNRTPVEPPRGSPIDRAEVDEEDEEEDEASKQARLQLQAGLENVTTFQNAAEHHRRNISMHSVGDTGTPPSTPPRKRESGGFPRINIPKIPDRFWEGQVNTLR